MENPEIPSLTKNDVSEAAEKEEEEHWRYEPECRHGPKSVARTSAPPSRFTELMSGIPTHKTQRTHFCWSHCVFQMRFSMPATHAMSVGRRLLKSSDLASLLSLSASRSLSDSKAHSPPLVYPPYHSLSLSLLLRRVGAYLLFRELSDRRVDLVQSSINSTSNIALRHLNHVLKL